MAIPRTDQTWAAAPGTNDGALLGRNTTGKVGYNGAVPIVKPIVSLASVTAATLATALASAGIITTTA